MKQEHLRLFRPNLANPANKQTTLELDKTEKKRNDEQLDVSPVSIANNLKVD